MVLTLEGRLQWLRWVLGLDTPPAMTVALYAMDVLPTVASKYTDYSGHLATFTGSTPQALLFGTPLQSRDGARVAGVPQVYVCTVAPGSPETIYGYIIYAAGTSKLIAVHRFEDANGNGDPIVVAAVNDAVPVAPILGLGGCD